MRCSPDCIPRGQRHSLGKTQRCAIVVLASGVGRILSDDLHTERLAGIDKTIVRSGTDQPGRAWHGQARQRKDIGIEVIRKESPDIACGRTRRIASAEVIGIAHARREGDDADLAPGECRAGRHADGECAESTAQGPRYPACGRDQRGRQLDAFRHKFKPVIRRGSGARGGRGCRGDGHSNIFTRLHKFQASRVRGCRIDQLRRRCLLDIG